MAPSAPHDDDDGDEEPCVSTWDGFRLPSSLFSKTTDEDDALTGLVAGWGDSDGEW